MEQSVQVNDINHSTEGHSTSSRNAEQVIRLQEVEWGVEIVAEEEIPVPVPSHMAKMGSNNSNRRIREEKIKRNSEKRLWKDEVMENWAPLDDLKSQDGGERIFTIQRVSEEEWKEQADMSLPKSFDISPLHNNFMRAGSYENEDEESIPKQPRK